VLVVAMSVFVCLQMQLLRANSEGKGVRPREKEDGLVPLYFNNQVGTLHTCSTSHIQTPVLIVALQASHCKSAP
jgi:hypothetical protein